MSSYQKILITDASGYVGAKLYDYLKHLDQPVIGTYHSESVFEELFQIDITQEGTVASFLKEQQPDLIIHTAANSSSSWCEKHPEEAYDLNVNGTKYFVDYAKSAKAKMILLSSFAAFNPTTVYGETKVEAEKLVKKLNEYVIIRPSLIVGESPNTTASKLFNQVVHMITDRNQVKMDSSWKFEVTYLRHLAEVIYKIIRDPEIKNLTIPVVAKGLTSRYQIAQELLFDYEITVEEIDEERIIPLPKLDLSMFKKYSLFEYTYDEVIAELEKELQHLLKA